MPEVDFCKKLQVQLKRGNLTKWRHHPLWDLLYEMNQGPTYIEKALVSVRSRVQRYIWTYPPERGERRRSTRLDVTKELTDFVAECRNLDSLLTLTAWAREAREDNILRPYYQSASQSREIFPYVICHSPHLYVRWPLLAEFYKKLIWAPPITDTSEPWFDMRWDDLYDEIHVEEKKARNDGIRLPPKDIFRRINKHN